MGFKWGWVAVIALATAGCSDDGVEGACEDFCNDIANCFGAGASDSEVSECQTECAGSFGDLSEECEDPAIEILECSAAALCGDGDLEGCATGIDVPDSCGELLDGGDCCSADDPCDWANDGFCDCGGEFSWDDADCST